MVFDPTNTTQNAAANSLLNPNKRIISEEDINVSIDSTDAAVLLDVGYPMGFNKTTNMWGPWMAPDATVFVVDIASRTGGTWGMTVDSLVIANTVIAWNATAAVVTELLRVNGYVVTVDLTSKVYTITFSNTPEIETLPTVSGDVTQLTGGSADATATATAGTATLGKQVVRGFVNPEVIQTGINTGTAALVVLTGTDTVCTGTLVNHGLRVGMSITVSGATEAKLNITATLTAVTSDTFTYTVAAVSGGTVDSGVYTTTNDIQAVVMVKGKINRNVPSALVATADVTALDTAMKTGLIAAGLIVQGLNNKY